MGERQTVGGLLDAARARLERLQPSAARAALGRGALLIDTRCPELREAGGIIPSSVHVPPSTLYWRRDRPTAVDTHHEY